MAAKARDRLPRRAKPMPERARARGARGRYDEGEGRHDSSADSARVRNGPGGILELFDWPSQVSNDLFADPVDGKDAGLVRFFNMKRHLSRGVVCVSDFSGWDSQEEALRLTSLSFSSMSPSVGGKVCRRGFSWVRASDKEQVPQQAFLIGKAKKRSDFSPCVFGDIFERLSSDVTALVNACIAPDSASSVREKHRTVQECLHRYSGVAFPIGSQCMCLVHRQPCPTSPMAALDSVLAHHKAAAKQASCPWKRRRAEDARHATRPWWRAAELDWKWQDEPGEEHLTDAMRRRYLSLVCNNITKLEDDDDGHRAADDIEDDIDMDGEEQHDPLDPLLMSWGSTVCNGYTTMGNREQDKHESEPSHNLWSEERRTWASREHEDLYFHENSPGYDPSRLENDHEATHTVKSIVFGGFLLGFPYDRRRRYTFGYSKKFKWIGAEDYAKEFQKLMQRSVECDGDIYFMAPEEEIVQEYQRMSKLRGNMCTLEPGERPDLTCPEVSGKFLCPGAALRIQDYKKLRDVKGSTDSVFLVDLDHNVDSAGPCSGSRFPTLDTHAVTYSFTKRRVAVGLEQFAAHGLHVYKEASQRWEYPHVDLLKERSYRQKQKLIGGSLFLPSVASFVYYMMSNLVCLDDPIAPPPTLRSESEECSEEFPEEEKENACDESEPHDDQQENFDVSDLEMADVL